MSFAALGVGAVTGVLHEDTPGWAWVPAVILCDVAHVWSTLFRTYLDPVERQARRHLLVMVPAVGLALSVALFALGELAFWRALAYLAIFHFVRQQYGWVALYRDRATLSAHANPNAPSRFGLYERVGRLIDTTAIYAATLWPLLYWHTHVPRCFSWFFPGDIVALPPRLMPVATVVYAGALSAYAIRSLAQWVQGTPNPGRDVVVVTTALAWYVGIVAFNSDYAFTVTNVFMHGIPYFAIVYGTTRARATSTLSTVATPTLAVRLTRNLPVFFGFLWLVAFAEEMLWDRAVWHDHTWIFGEGWTIGAAKLVVVPLLALPQLTHYILDGVIWRRRHRTYSVSEPVTPR